VTFDLIVAGGDVVDGSSGAVPKRADIGIREGRIEAVDDLSQVHDVERLDATGLVVAPGFIDAHVHSERALLGGPDIDRFGSLVQGVTTHTTGADGFGWAPIRADQDPASLWRSTCFAYGERELHPSWPTIDSYLESFAGRSPVNVLPFAPHQAIRYAVLGWETRAPDAQELSTMVGLTGEWLEAGAAGLATGLDYQPAGSASTDELITLARVAGAAGAIYASHQRYISSGRERAWRESIEIGRQANVPVAIAHEYADETSEHLLDEANGDGVELTFDWYAYPAGCTHLLASLPMSDHVGGPDGLLERLRKPAERDRVGVKIADAIDWPGEPGSWAYFAATRTGRHIGQTVKEVASDRGVSVAVAAAQLLEEELPDALLVYRRGIQPEAFVEQVRRTVTHPGWSLASDGVYHGALPHPRGWGCHARFLRLAVRELRALTLGEAVHRMSGFVADRLRLKDRGRIAVGLAADLVLFDPATVADQATWEEPRLPPIGIRAVLVNGELAVADGRPTGRLAGRLLRAR
jgi:N-acyl-D-amino-acid deacylase